MILQTMLTITPYSCGTDIPTVISELQYISTKVFNWYGNNHIKANPGKCHLLLFCLIGIHSMQG